MTGPWKYGEQARIDAAIENEAKRDEVLSSSAGRDADAMAADEVYGRADRTVDSADRWMRLRGAW